MKADATSRVFIVFFRSMLVLLICLIVPACSYTYMDEQGRKHVMGFVHLTIDEAQPTAPIAGHQVTVKSVGVGLVKTPIQSGITLGYTSQSLLALRNNSLVQFETDQGAAGAADIGQPDPAHYKIIGAGPEKHKAEKSNRAADTIVKPQGETP